MREWLTVIISLLIAGILLDGLRRMRRARRESLRVSRSVRRFDEEGLPEPKNVCSQPRVVSYRDNRDAATLTRSMQESFAKSKVTVGAPNRAPEQASLNLQESVPMLMDSVDELQQRQDERLPRRARDYTQAPSWAEPDTTADAGVTEGDDDISCFDEELGDHDQFDSFTEADEPSLGSTESLEDGETLADFRREPGSRSEPEITLDALSRQSGSATGDMSAVAETGAGRSTEPAVDESDSWIEPEEVLIINMMAPGGAEFDGSQLLEALLQQDLRFGSMNIFHRHKYPDGSGPVYFSLANMVVPGTFNLSRMHEFSTPGISMFLGLPNNNSLAAFDCMAATAKALVKQLGGELKDENRSVMTQQTIEHCRQRVIEFERKQRLMQH